MGRLVMQTCLHNKTVVPPAFPVFSSGSNGRTAAMAAPNYSYGIAGDFHPTSFEIYGNSLTRYGKRDKMSWFKKT
jgi:hypothetical protein